MEELLNKLIEKGYRPFGKKAEHCLGCRYNNDWSEMYKYVGFIGGDDVVADRKVPLRSLVSINSGLWQFVCENGMVNKNKQYSFIKWSWKGRTDERNQQSYRYRLIESALCDEDKLEQFLLGNIKVE